MKEKERKGTLVDDLNDFDGFCSGMKPGNIIVITGDAQSGKTKLAMKVAHAFAPDADCTDACICLGRSGNWVSYPRRGKRCAHLFVA